MKVGIDSDVLKNKHGIGVYGSNIVKHLEGLNDISVEYFSYHDYYSKINPVDKAAKFFMRSLYWASGDVYWEWYKLPKLADGIDIFHSLSGCVPKKASFKTLMTVHDLAYYEYDNYLQPSVSRFYKSWYRKSAENADMIIAISKSTKKDIIRYWDVPSKQIKVIHLGTPEDFISKIPEIKVSKVKRKYKLSRDYFLFSGQLNYRKNIHTLLKAFAKVSVKNKVDLVLTGDKSILDYVGRLGKIISEHNLKNRVKILGPIPRNDLIAIYRGALGLTFPTLYEGFGFPVLEGFASGIPVISSNTSSIPEVAGDAALFVDPNNVDDIRDAMTTIISDENIRKKLISRGAERVKDFTWEKTAKKTTDLYLKVSNQ